VDATLPGTDPREPQRSGTPALAAAS
jgi:hypothetical protein